MLRYLKRWIAWVLLLALAGSALVFWYGMCRQTYTAEVSLVYAGEGAEAGLNPDGSPGDVTEICSTAVLNRVISQLELTQTPDSIRAMCTVSGALSPEEQAETVRTEYIVRLTAGGDWDAASVRRVLEAMVENYIALYGGTYADPLSLPDFGGAEVSDETDFLRSAELLEDSAEEMLAWLEERREIDFRSSATGYSFGDLYEAYAWFRDNELPVLSAAILEGRFTKDRDALLSACGDRIERDGLTIDGLDAELSHLWEMLDGYTGGPLIQRYVDLLDQAAEARADQEWAEYVYRTYGSDEPINAGTAVTAEELQERLDSLAERMKACWALADAGAREYRAYLAAQSVLVQGSVRVEEGLNLPLYTALAAFALLALGCMGAIALGRLTELGASVRDTDQETGLPNRACCRRVIERLSAETLEPSFTVMVFRLRTPEGQAGKSALEEFGRMLRRAAEPWGFAGYDGGGRFYGFFENCPLDRAKLFCAMLREEAQAYSCAHPYRRLSYDEAVAESGTEGIYEIQGLMWAALSKLGQKYGRR